MVSKQKFLRPLSSVGETMNGGLRTKSKYQGCSIDKGDEWHQFRSGKMSIISF